MTVEAHYREHTMAIQQVQESTTAMTLPSHTRGQRIDRYLYRPGRQLGDLLLHYWAHMLTFILGLIVLIALHIPFLSYFGLDVIAKPLFFALHTICAQIPSHSFYIYGHQLGLCVRNLFIYSSMFLGGLVFVLSKKRLPGIPWWVWFLMMLPMAVDGTTQLVGWRESTWELRVITGTLFGLGSVWFALPLVQKYLREIPQAGTMSTNAGSGNCPLPPVEQGTSSSGK
jgi:uncharacterized membrane protein